MWAIICTQSGCISRQAAATCLGHVHFHAGLEMCTSIRDMCVVQQLPHANIHTITDAGNNTAPSVCWHEAAAYEGTNRPAAEPHYTTP